MMKYCLGFLLCSLALGNAIGLSSLLDDNNPLVDELKKTVMETIQKTVKAVSKDDLDQLKAMEVKYEDGTNTDTGLRCSKFTFTGSNNCVVTSRAAILTDSFRGVFRELSKVTEFSEVPIAMMRIFLHNPCSCEPITVSDGCNKIMKTIFGVNQLYCDAQVPLMLTP